MLFIASPDKTGCVAYATTFLAPLFFKAVAALHRVPAVSTMSSTSTQVPFSTSPIKFITSLSLGDGLLLSMIARSQSSCFATARALTTPPMSGETTRKFL